MTQRCRLCSRANPAEALYCYHDGAVLDSRPGMAGPLAVGAQLFLSPFVFPSGRTCRSFNELVLACEADWEGARDMLRRGYLEGFLAATGRADLARAAHHASQSSDPDRGLDELLDKLPGDIRQPPRLRVQPQEVNLGRTSRAEDRHFVLQIENQGMGLLTGSVSAEDAPWLVLGEGAGSPRKVFQCRGELRLPVRVHGKGLRAGIKPIEGRLLLGTSGGTTTVTVRVEVPVTPFPDGALAGAITPRQVAEKAREDARRAAPLFENGAVAAWYEANGWTYPVQGPAATGKAAVQQFFEALGLARAPRVDISEQTVHLKGAPGQPLEHVLILQTQEQRHVFAHATTGVPWLKVGRARLDGKRAYIPLRVPEVPFRPGELLLGKVLVVSNGNQRFVVEISLGVNGQAAAPRPGVPHWSAPPAVRQLPPLPPPAPPPLPVPVLAVPPLVAVEVEPVPVTVAPAPVDVAPKKAAPVVPAKTAGVPSEEAPPRKRWPLLAAPAALSVLLLAMLVHDLLLPREQVEDGPELIDPTPRVLLQFHDGPKKGPDDEMPRPTMRFGLGIPEAGAPGLLKTKLTFDEWGRSNNTCVRLDGTEALFGHEPPGRWVKMKEALGIGPGGRERLGLASTWELPRGKLRVRQEVEIVPGEQSRLLDTCLVRYVLENQDDRTHRVGIRFMLDTYIGANDGVPFTIPGASGLCDTQAVFGSAAEVPDFIEALEKDDLRQPGTIAHLQLRLGGRIEAPSKVTLGGWPNQELKRFGYLRANAQLTGWDVPIVGMRDLDRLARRVGQKADPDSAVTMYWEEQPLAPGGRREVGFAYGLGTVSSGEGGGRLLLSVGGRMVRGGEFTLTALVNDPAPDEQLALDLPAGFRLVEGSSSQAVPSVPARAARPTSPVTWRIRAGDDGRYEITVRSNKGATQKQKIAIRTRGLLD